MASMIGKRKRKRPLRLKIHGVARPILLNRLISVKLSMLPFAPHRLFKLPPRALFLDTATLVLQRCRPEGVRNANRLMRQAYAGKVAKRAPVSARPLGAGRFLIVDGNSTVVNCLFSGWTAVPVLIGRKK